MLEFSKNSKGRGSKARRIEDGILSAMSAQVIVINDMEEREIDGSDAFLATRLATLHEVSIVATPADTSCRHIQVGH